jgi:hypothetical protein
VTITSQPRPKLAQFLDKRLDELKGTAMLVEIAHKMVIRAGTSSIRRRCRSTKSRRTQRRST